VALALAAALSVGETENGVDRALLAGRAGRRVVELESYRDQLAIFDRLPAAEQLDMLEIVAAGADRAAAESARQLAAWRTGDTATLEAAMETGLLADPELREALLSARNRAWTEKVDELLKGGGSLFVAVGAAHLIGSEGLAAALRERGYIVNRVQ
jgi:uncharacterized protein YbaP (TraB family)